MNTILMLQGSLYTILQNWHLFAYLLFIQCVFAALTAWFMSDISIDKESLAILCFLGGILGFTLFSLGIMLLKIKSSPSLSLITIISACLILVMYGRNLYALISVNLAKLGVFFLFIFLLRLIFIRNLLVPPYADSVQHLQIVQDFLNPNQSPQAFYRLSFDLGHYYHFSFHALAAFLSGVTSTSPAQTILFLGQYFQALAILAVYPIARILMKDSLSAWAVMIVAGLILSIPAYASNWGKYPAIASLTGISFGLSLLLIYAKDKSVASRKFWWLISFAIISATCLHSRSLFVLLFSVLALAFYARSKFVFEKLELNDNNDNKTIVIILWAVMLYIFTPALEFPPSPFLYFLEFLFVGLSILAFYSDFILTWILITFLLIMGYSLLLPLPFAFLPTRYTILFDRPFLVIFFYLPASILIWEGLEGGMRFLAKNRFEIWRRWLFAGVLIFGLANAIFVQNHYPSDCCIFVDDNDLFSFHWMKKNISEKALIGISATGKPGNLLPVDGGAWVELFTGLATRKLVLFENIDANNLDWNTDYASIALSLCKEGITHFYVDNLENSFDEYYLIKVGASYEFGLGDVRIYSLDCKVKP